LKQLGIALEMGSPSVVIRCHLYFALSLLQTGRLHAAKRLISSVFSFVFLFLYFVSCVILSKSKSVTIRQTYQQPGKSRNCRD